MRRRMALGYEARCPVRYREHHESGRKPSGGCGTVARRKPGPKMVSDRRRGNGRGRGRGRAGEPGLEGGLGVLQLTTGPFISGSAVWAVRVLGP